MTISNARATLELLCKATPTGTNVSRAITLGQSVQSSLSTANVAYSVTLTGAGTSGSGWDGSVNLETGAVTTVGGTVTIERDGIDYEGNTFDLAGGTIDGIMISCSGSSIYGSANFEIGSLLSGTLFPGESVALISGQPTDGLSIVFDDLIEDIIVTITVIGTTA